MNLLEHAKKQGWTCTDPDNFQYGKKISEKVFVFKELDVEVFQSHFGATDDEDKILFVFDQAEFWNEDEINLDDYSYDEIYANISSYYGTLDKLISDCGDSSNWIIAECIFEESNIFN